MSNSYLLEEVDNEVPVLPKTDEEVDTSVIESGRRSETTPSDQAESEKVTEDDPEVDQEEEEEELEASSLSVKSSDGEERPRTVRTRSLISSDINCGYLDKEGNRILYKYSEYFGTSVDVYTAVNDKSQTILYRPSLVAKKIECGTSPVGMFLHRHKSSMDGIFQAIEFHYKPHKTSGLKAGAYFVSEEICIALERHFLTSTGSRKRKSRKLEKTLLTEQRSRKFLEGYPTAAAAATAAVLGNGQGMLYGHQQLPNDRAAAFLQMARQQQQLHPQGAYPMPTPAYAWPQPYSYPQPQQPQQYSGHLPYAHHPPTYTSQHLPQQPTNTYMSSYQQYHQAHPPQHYYPVQPKPQPQSHHSAPRYYHPSAARPQTSPSVVYSHPYYAYQHMAASQQYADPSTATAGPTQAYSTQAYQQWAAASAAAAQNTNRNLAKSMPADNITAIAAAIASNAVAVASNAVASNAAASNAAPATADVPREHTKSGDELKETPRESVPDVVGNEVGTQTGDVKETVTE